MTDEEAAALAALSEKATPGPWVVYEGDDYEVTDTAEPAGMVWQPAWSDEEPEYEERYPFERHKADATFIAASREAIPALLAERAALLAFARAVANGETVMRHAVFPAYGGDLTDTAAEPIGYTWHCAACGCAFSSDENNPQDRHEAVQRIQHAAGCIVGQARTLLAGKGQPD